MTFDVHLIDYCNLATTAIAPSMSISKTYKIDDPTYSFNFDAFTATPSYCPLTYSYSSVPTLPTGILNTFDSATRLIEIGTTNPTHVGTFNIDIIALTESGLGTGDDILIFIL